MNAVILAAGEGQRMNSMVPKVLLPLHGLPLIARTILALKHAGINSIVVTVGFEADSVMGHLGDGSKYGVNIRYVVNDQYERGNATSVLKAEELVENQFLLVMGDHVFTPDIIGGIMELNASLAVVVATDSSPGYVQVEEATKVLVESDEIQAIGRDLTEFNAVDMGIFLCSKEIFSVVRECVRGGREEWSECIAEYAKNHKVVSFDASGSFWVDVDTKEDLRRAEAILKNSLTKSGDGFISRNVNRKISTAASRYLVNTSVTPNQITIVSFVTAVVSAIAFSLGQYTWVVVGGVLSQLASILDGVDGEIARLKFLESSYGSWLDACLDRYADSLIILGIAWGYWIIRGNTYVWSIALLCLVGVFMISYARARFQVAYKQEFGRVFMTRDVRLFIIFAAAVSGRILYCLIFLAVATNLEVVVRLLAAQKTAKSEIGNP